MNALVTIAIPCLNAARWLRGAIESALTQTWPATEVIVVDDGSTDGSDAIARSFGERIRYFRNEGKGAPAARNLATREARGEWLQFLDADDALEPEKIARQLAECAQGEAADVIYSPVWMETWRDGVAVSREPSTLDPALDPFAQWLAWQLPQTGGTLWRKSALDSLGGWKADQPCCQEHELYLRALQAGLRFVLAPQPGAIYRLWSEETLCRKDPRLVIRVKTALIDRLEEWMRERSLWTETHQRLAGRACFEMARTLARYDLGEAAAYHHERRERGLLTLSGDAAPSAYVLAYRLLGFVGAERLALARRRAA